MQAQQRTAGFTLIELMVVVIIIAMIAGLVVMNVTDEPDKKGRMLAEVDISTLGTTLQRYRLDHGRYPTQNEGLAILTRPAPDKGQNEPYVEHILDPWRQEYRFKIPGVHKEYSFDLWSIGPDGQDGTDDDVTNWKQKP